MGEFAKEVFPVNLEDEMKHSYLAYAMRVIVGRALPDVRDGLKPVHRRVLYAMSELGNDWNKPYKKSARVVGDVIGKYHPHGESAVYDAIVRMAQPFSMRYMLVDGQGNFGSVDGDPPAAMRYTEVRMARIAHVMLADLDKETVEFIANYDESELEPIVLPTRLPNLLVNGSTGIAVGMATNIPPHNLAEVVDACLALIDDSSLGIEDLMRHVPGPDFPTAALINGAHGIVQAYHSGRGRIYVRARYEVETEASSGRESIVVTELPYQVNKAQLLEKIADLVKEKRIEGISDLRDESDKDGMRMVIELRRGEVPEVVVNNLFQHTQLENVFGINMVALVDGEPKLLDLKQLLELFLRHRREVVTRRTIFELRKARERGHILEGLAVALANIDPIIALIKASSSPSVARAAMLERLWEPGVVTAMLERADVAASRPEDLASGFGLTDAGYQLSEVQAQAILDLRLQKLTGLEQDKVLEEYRGILEQIRALLEILADPVRLMEVIRAELLEIRDEYSDERRTEIVSDRVDLTLEDLISEEDLVVTLSHGGYIKSQPLSVYRSQRRGGKGKLATDVKEEDFIEQLFVANTHDTILSFSSRGKVYWSKAYEFPQATRVARGKPIVNLLPLEDGERINAVLPVGEFPKASHVFMATGSGIVKKTPLHQFSRPRASGIIALDLKVSDQLVGITLTDGDSDIMLFTSGGKAIRFSEELVRPMGRTACGVRGIRLRSDETVISLMRADQGDVLTVTERGFGKRTPVEEFPRHGRGGQGVITIRTSARNGSVVGAVQVAEDDEIMLITSGGTLVRLCVGDVSRLGRNTQGVKLITLSGDEKLVGITRIEARLVEDEAADCEPE
jgi:DNA gyrase subunit A